jgi:CRP-like cAMP-binding protein
MGVGDFFGELALVDGGPRSETAVAAKDNTQLLILDKYRFTYLLRHQPDFALIVMGKLCARLRDKNRTLS